MTRTLLLTLLLAAQVASAAVVTRGPYLQTPTPAAVTVRWRTDTPTDSRVAYGPAPGSLTSFADDPASTTEHVVTVTGLTSGTQYFYSVGTTLGPLAGDDAAHWFRSAPAPGTPVPIRLWSIGDAGFVGPPLDAVRDAYKTFNGGVSTADAFLLLGDNAYLVGNDAQYQAAVFDVHAEMLRTTPVWSTFGNHERPSSMDLTQTGPYFDMFSFPTAAEAGGVASGTEAYYSFDHGNVHFVVLDSEDHTPVSPAGPMLTWLESDLMATTADWVVAFWHRPPYSKGQLHDSDVETNEINMRQWVLPVLEDHGVDLVLSGHSHNYERSYLLDGHYGLSPTFSSANQVDAGDGSPDGDGAYRKPTLGPAAHEGAVYVVNGSGSEFRNATLNHPAHVVGLLETGSLVIDVNGNVLTAQFLTGAGELHDHFRIVKGPVCGTVPATGCQASAGGVLAMRNDADSDARDRWSWTWNRGPVDAAEVGAPTEETDVAVCVYDQGGSLVGGAVPPGVAEWSATPNGFRYFDRAHTRHGLQRIRIKQGTGTKGLIQVRAKGAGIAMPPLPATFPVTAQLVNVDTGACWETVFPAAIRNGPVMLRATW